MVGPPSTGKMDIPYVIGVDAGGSSSHAVSVSRTGKLLRQRRGQASNPYVYGFEASIRNLCFLLRFVIADNTSPPTAILVALSGADTLSFCADYTKRLSEALSLPLSTQVSVSHDLIGPLGLLLPYHHVVGENKEEELRPDACLGAHFAVLIAGTGSVAGSFRVASPKSPCLSTEEIWYSGPQFAVAMMKKCGGRGPLLGDFGSAYDISVSALSFALRVVDDLEVSARNLPDFVKDSDASTLKQSALEVLQTAFRDFGVESGSFGTNVDKLVAHFHSNALTRGCIANLSSPFSHLAMSGNLICRYAFYKAGHILGQHLVTVSKHFSEKDRRSPFHMIATGGVFMAWTSVNDFQEAFKEAVYPITKRGGQIMVRTASSCPVHGYHGQSHALACAGLVARAHGWNICSSNGNSDVLCSCSGGDWIP